MEIVFLVLGIAAFFIIRKSFTKKVPSSISQKSVQGNFIYVTDVKGNADVFTHNSSNKSLVIGNDYKEELLERTDVGFTINYCKAYFTADRIIISSYQPIGDEQTHYSASDNDMLFAAKYSEVVEWYYDKDAQECTFKLFTNATTKEDVLVIARFIVSEDQLSKLTSNITIFPAKDPIKEPYPTDPESQIE